MAHGLGIGVSFTSMILVAEEPVNVVNTTVADAIALDGTTIPYISNTGNVLCRMVGRAQTAIRPLNITVDWGGQPMMQQAFFVESGAGGAFVGIWTLFGTEPGEGDVVITCGTNNAGCTAIRVGETSGSPSVVMATAMAGYSLEYELTANAILVAGGCTVETGFPINSDDFETQWGVKIPANRILPNRTNGLSAYFGLTYSAAEDGIYTIEPSAPTNGAIAVMELRSGGQRAAKEG